MFIHKKSKDALILSGRSMAPKERRLYGKSKSRKIVAGDSVNELVAWFDHKDSGDYLKQMPEVDFDVDIKRRKHLVSLDPELSAKVTRIAKAKKTSSETLINSWVREKISEPKSA